MPDAILHTNLHQAMDTVLAPEQVAEILQSMPLAIKLGDYDGDNLPFQADDGDVEIDGVIQRWHGTESRIVINSEVDIPQIPNVLRYAVIASFVVLVLGILWYMGNFIVQIDCGEATNGLATACAEPTVSTNWFVLLLMAIIMIAGIAGVFYLQNADPYASRRWNAQQKMGKLINHIFEAIITKETRYN